MLKAYESFLTGDLLRWIGIEAIASSPHGGQISWLGGIVFDLIPQTLDVDKDGVVIRDLALPDFGEDLLLGQ